MAAPVVLIIEDEPDLVELMSDELKGANIAVQSCDDVQGGIVKTRNQKYSAIILDLRIKGGTGDEILNRIRENPKHMNFNTPVFVTSGHIDQAAVDKLKGKITKAFTKPYDTQVLLQAIQKVISE